MAENQQFYSISDYGDRLQPADSIKIEHHIYIGGDGADISPLTALPLEQLQTMRQDSAAAEQTIFESLREATGAWEEQAAQTLLLDKAIEYVRTLPVKHTANKWELGDYDYHEISNMVYKMTYRVNEDNSYGRNTQKFIPYSANLTWDVFTNTPNHGRREKIAGQSRKHFTDKAEMEKYLNGRIKAYSHLFTELSPPIPQEYKSIFTVNGKLLPGYTVQGEEQQPDRAADISSVAISEPNLDEPRKEIDEMQDPINIQLSAEIGATDGAWLKLPATAEQLQTALARIGVPNGEQGKDFFITASENNIPGFTPDMAKTADINELNLLAAVIEKYTPEETQKLALIADGAGRFDNAGQLLRGAADLNAYEIIPGVSNPVQLGEYLLADNIESDVYIPELWKEAIDLEKLGKLVAAAENGRFGKHGYICEDREPLLIQREFAEQYRLTANKPAPEHANMDAAAAPAATIAAQTSTVIPLNLTAENPRERMKEITGKLEAGIKGIFESEQYKTYLKTLSKFHNYSMNNCLLIAMQKPDATQIAGFNAWRDDFKRQVMKGEKGIKIIAPSPFKTKKAVDRVDASGRPVVGKDGRRVKDEVEITVPAFKVATVFDVSQTEGEPLPQIGVDELTGSVDRYKEFFAALEKSAPVPVAFEPIASGAKGYYQQMEKRIAINEGMSELQNVKTLIHEIAHARLHAIDTDKPIKGQDLPDRRTREVEAESIAYTVCQRYGLDTSDYSFAYVATWSGEKQLDALKSSLETIRKEADAIISEVDKHFTELQQTAEKPVPEKQPGYEKWSEPATPENAPENPGVPSDDISAYLPQQSQGDTFTIYQLKDGDETRDIRFEPLAALTAAGLAVEMANYDKTYTAPLAEGATLEKIYFTLNMDKPEDFKGHALSVSDVVVMNRDGKETAFYVDGKGFQELPNFLAPKEQEKPIEQTKPVDLKAVADYMQKLNDALQAAKPDSAMSVGAYNATVKRLEQANAKIPDTQPQLKTLISNAAQSPDLPTLKERMNTLHTEFTQHYATAAQMAIDTSGKAQPPAPAASQPNAAPKAPTRGENVAAIEAKVNAGETINLSDLAGAIKADKAAQPTQTAKPPYSRGKSAYTPTPPKNPSIKDKIQAGKDEIAKSKPAPGRAAAKSKNAGLGD